MIQRTQIFILCGLTALVGGAAVAQQPMGIPRPPDENPANEVRPVITKGSNVINFASKVGSFKVLAFNDTSPTKGTLSFSFNGSVLVSGLKGTITTAGDVREEYKNDTYEKRLFFGKGMITLVGEVRSVQFFGRDVQGSLKGEGLITFYGEFDNNLQTGWSQYPGGEKIPWGTGGMQKQVPEMKIGPSSNIKIEKSG